MHSVVIHLTPEILARVEALAKYEERTRAAQTRYLLRLGLEAEEERLKASQAIRKPTSPPPVSTQQRQLGGRD